MYLICCVTSQDDAIMGLCNFMIESISLYATIVPSILAVGMMLFDFLGDLSRLRD